MNTGNVFQVRVLSGHPLLIDPFNTYAAGWGTSFSAPFVSGASSLLINKRAGTMSLRPPTP
jgi:subtilisin family serine protease